MSTPNLDITEKAFQCQAARKNVIPSKRHKKNLEKYPYNKKTSHSKGSSNGNGNPHIISVNFSLTLAPKKMKLHSVSEILSA